MKPIDNLSEEEFAELLKRGIALPDAPPALVRAAIDQWPAVQRSALNEAAREIVKRVTAALTFDSWVAGPLAFGMRAVPSDARHLLFSAAGRDIDVRIVPIAEQFALTGQILGPDECGIVELGEVPLRAAGATTLRTTSLDALGEFRLEGVPHGSYVLTLRLGEEEIVLPPIEVGERRR